VDGGVDGGTDPVVRERPDRRFVQERVRGATDALEHLVGGLGTAVPALAALAWVLAVALTCLVGVGLVLVPSALRVTHAVADRERERLSRWGPRPVDTWPLPGGSVAALRDAGVRRELGWLAVHGTLGFVVGLIGLALPLYALQSFTFPFWYRLVPSSSGPGLAMWRIDGLADALVVALTGVGWLAAVVALGPGLARLQAATGRALLPPTSDVDLALRVAELTATRAAALDAHAVELRRIERSLHDGAQNRLVAVTVLVGAARRALARDPAVADAALGRAQDAAEQALAELRSLVRGILPPVLSDRGLAGALDGLVDGCGVPCTLDVDLPGRCAASVEATAYFVVAEALTNVVKHSGAGRAAVTARRHGDRLVLRVDDDGKGGASPDGGSGLAGMHRRVLAHDGGITLTSPPGGPTTLLVELPCGS